MAGAGSHQSLETGGCGVTGYGEKLSTNENLSFSPQTGFMGILGRIELV
jgi:hypothetical protein